MIKYQYQYFKGILDHFPMTESRFVKSKNMLKLSFRFFQPTTHQQVFPDDVVIGVDDLEPVHSAHHHHQQQHQRPPRPEGRTLHQQRQREEYVELQKRESDI